MAPVHEVYRLLAKRDHISVDRAMAAALATADPVALGLCGKMLLDRGQTAGLLGLVLHFHRLDGALRQALIARADQLGKPLRDAGRAAQGRGPANMLEIIRQAGAGRLAYLVTEQLRRGEGERRELAAATLLSLVERTEEAAAPVPAREATDIADAVEEAVEQYAVHRQARVIHAFLRLAPRPMPRAMAGLADKHNPAIEVVRRMLADPTEPAAGRSVLYFLQAPALRTPAIEGLVKLADRGELSSALACVHVLARPGLAGYLHRLRTLKGMTPSVGQLRHFPPHAARMLPRWLDALPLDTQQRVEALAALRRSPEPTARLLALRRLIAIAREGDLFGVNSVISTFCDDEQMPIARMALRHLMHIGWAELAKLMLRMVNSPHEAVRDMARGYLGPIAFDRLWQGWPRLTHGQRLSAGAALAKVDPAFSRTLATKLTAGERETVIRALSIIDTLKLGESFEDALLMLGAGPDEVIAASAVRALGGVGTSRAVQQLEAALEHADSRVRANAVEALQQHKSTRHMQRLLEMAEDDDNRPRANAIGALMDLRAADAIASLHRMLADGRAAQRRSALWLAEHMGLIEVAGQVAELSISDPDAQVSASQAVQNLIALMHARADAIEHEQPPRRAAS